jgi:hypothetical protein
MQQFPDGEVAEKNQPRGKVSKTFRVIGKVAGYLFIAIFVAVVVGYNYVMRPAFLEPLIVKQFAENTNGKIEIKVDQASLFRGFRFRNVVVHPPAGFKQTPILKAREINLLYNVYGFFRGKFGVHEIAFKDAEVYIDQKKNVMSVEALMKPSKKQEPEKEEPESPSGKSSVVSWFFDVQIFARFILENFNFTLDAQDASNKVRQYAHLKNFNFNFSLLTRDFNKIDTGNPAAAVALLNALVIELNPQKTIDMSFQGPPARVNTKLDLFWRLFYDGQSKRPEFVSNMHFGQDKIPVALGGRATQNLSFLVDHKIEYNAKEDRLKIDNFLVKFLGDTVLSLSGGGERVLTAGRSVDIQTGASRVNLGEVFKVVSGLTGKRDPSYSGYFSVKPTSVAVRGNTVDDKGGIKLERVQVRSGSLNISIPTLEFDHAAFIDQKRKGLPVRNAQVKLRSGLNGAGLNFDASIAEDKKTAVNFSLRGFNITPFAQGQAQGEISTTFSAVGDSPQNLGIHFRVFSPQLYYFVDRGKSGINRIDLNLKGSVKSSEDFSSRTTVNLPVMSFSHKDKDYGSAVDIKSHVIIERDKALKILYTLDALTIGFKESLVTLPVALQEGILTSFQIANPGRTLRADGETAVTISGNDIAVNHSTHLAIPDMHVDDIEVNAKTRITPTFISLDLFRITGLNKALLISADGNLKQGSETVTDPKTGREKRSTTMIPDIRYKVELSRPEETELLPDSFLIGVFSLAGNAKDNIVNGKIKIDNLSFRSKEVRVNKVNMVFPFRHDLKLKKTLNLRAGNKEHIIKNYNFNREYNFSISGIDIRDPNNKKEWLNIVYPRGNYPAIGASMEYKDNVFVMPVMQMYTLNGVVTISDTLFNLGRLRPSEMEYSSTIQIKDIDLKPMLLKEKAEGITDGKLRIDMLFTGNRLDKPVENLNGYISIFRIGPEFADTVMKAVMPKSSGLVNTLAANTTIPKKMDIVFRDGFVYSDIPMNKKLFGYLAASPDEIKNRRINIPEFFQRISDEASVYSAPAVNSGG